ncbi:8950_t:CDS:2, partial [Gigaspora rosea]
NQIIPFFTIAAGNLVVYFYSQYNPDKSDHLKQMLNVVTSGLFTASHATYQGILSYVFIGS